MVQQQIIPVQRFSDSSKLSNEQSDHEKQNNDQSFEFVKFGCPDYWGWSKHFKSPEVSPIKSVF